MSCKYAGVRQHQDIAAVGILLSTPMGLVEVRLFSFATPHEGRQVLDVNLVIFLEGRPIYSEVRRNLAEGEENFERSLGELIEGVMNDPIGTVPALKKLNQLLRGEAEAASCILPTEKLN